MHALIRLFWSVCQFKKGPEDVPYSWPLFTTSAIVNILMGWHQFSFRAPVLNAFLFACLMVGMMAVFTWLILFVKGYSARSVQTTTALFGVNVLINALIYPLMILSPVIQAIPVLIYFILLFVIALNVWLLMITAHIYARALALPFLAGVLVAMALFGIDLIVFSQLLQPTVTG